MSVHVCHFPPDNKSHFAFESENHLRVMWNGLKLSKQNSTPTQIAFNSPQRTQSKSVFTHKSHTYPTFSKSLPRLHHVHTVTKTCTPRRDVPAVSHTFSESSMRAHRGLFFPNWKLEMHFPAVLRSFRFHVTGISSGSFHHEKQESLSTPVHHSPGTLFSLCT